MSEQTPSRRWRAVVVPRWIAWHLFVIVAITAMMALGLWQFRRAEAGNSLSWAYTFEWPIFSVFAVVFWIKTIKDELRPPGEREPERDEMWLPPGVSAPPPWELDPGAKDPGARAASPAGETGPGAAPEAAGADGEGKPGPAKSDAELAEYNEYLARLSQEARSTHGKWHRSSLATSLAGPRRPAT